MTGRITWSEFGPGLYGSVIYGRALTGGPQLFKVVRGRRVRTDPQYHLAALLPGFEPREAMREDPEALKAIAEEWLSEFVTGLGAVFPGPQRERAFGEWEPTDDTCALAGELLENAGDAWDIDEAIEAVAVRYVRHLEAEVTRLGGRHAPWGGPGYRPTPEDVAEWEAATRSDSGGGDRCAECFGTHPPEPGSDGDSCGDHGHCYIPRDHPGGLDAQFQDWHGCPLVYCREGRWVS